MRERKTETHPTSSTDIDVTMGMLTGPFAPQQA